MGMTPTLVFDIETIPDAQGIRALLDVPTDTSDEDVVNIALHQRRQKSGNDFLPLYQHRICAISCALRYGDHFSIENTLRKLSLGMAVVLICLFYIIVA
jgi:predicted PolB exonuclease-like 3'-5' exonuclease